MAVPSDAFPPPQPTKKKHLKGKSSHVGTITLGRPRSL
jgi:hypothetical protein